MELLSYLRELNLVSVTVRVALAFVIGGLIGLERGLRNRPAGFRTYTLVCVGAALVMMTNQYAFDYFGVSDPVRMGAQVVSGIGFLGAGSIIITGRSQVRGITTAAGLWAAACCGLAIGIGFYEGALIGGLLVLVIMSLLQRADRHIHQRSHTMELFIELDAKTGLGELIEAARQKDLEIFDIQIQKNKLMKDGPTSVVLTATNPKKGTRQGVVEQLNDVPGVRYIEELR